jgi:tetratricopeptide (TPR) repeat protein
MERDGSTEELMKNLLSQPGFEQVRAVLKERAEGLTDDFFHLLGVTASRSGKRGQYEHADYLSCIGVEAARVAGKVHNIYLFTEARGLIASDAGDVKKASEHFSDALSAATEALESGDRAALSGVISTCLNLANLEVTRKNFEAAREIFSSLRAKCHALQSRAGELWAVANLASTSEAQGDYESALEYSSLLAQLYGEVSAEGEDGITLPDKRAVYEMLIRLTHAFYYNHEDYEKVAAVARHAITLVPADERGYVFLGYSQLRLKQFDDAVSTWSKLVAQYPEKAFNHTNLAGALLAAGRFEEAVAAIGEAIRISPHEQKYYMWRGQINERAGRHEDAIGDDQQAARLGAEAMAQSQPEVKAYKSQAEYERELPAGDVSELARLALINLYISLKRAEEAESEIRRLLQEGDGPTKAAAYFSRGELQQSLGNLEAAISSYSAAIELVPEHQQAHIRKADAHLSAGQLEQAVSELAFVAHRDRDPDLTVEKLKKIIEQHPDYYPALKWLGYAYLEQNRPSKAVETFTTALNARQDDVDVRLWRGLASIQVGAREEEQEWDDSFNMRRVLDALDDLGVAVRLATDNVEALEAYKWLVDRVTTDQHILFWIVANGNTENGLFSVLPAIRTTLENYFRANQLAVRRHWGDAIKLLKDVQKQLEEYGFPLFALRVNLDLADNYLRLYELQNALDHLASAERFPFVLAQPLTASLRPMAQEMAEKSRARSFSDTANIELEFIHVYDIGYKFFDNYLTILKALTFARLGDTDRALETLKDVDKFFEDVSQTLSSGVSFNALIGIVTILRDAGQLDHALELLLKLEPASPSDQDSVVLYNTAGIICEQAKDYEEALTFLQKAYDIAAANYHQEYLFGIAVNLAGNYAQTGRAEEALEVLRQVDVAKEAASEHEAYSYYAQLARVLKELGRYAEAQEAVLYALEITEGGRGRLRTFDTRMDWHARQEPIYQMAVQIAFANRESRTAFTLAEKAKARAFLDQLAAGHLPLPASGKALEDTELNLSEQRDLLLNLVNSIERRGEHFIDYEILRRLNKADDSLKLLECPEDGSIYLSEDKVKEALSRVEYNLDRLKRRKEEVRLESNQQTHGSVLSFEELRRTLGVESSVVR